MFTKNKLYLLLSINYKKKYDAKVYEKKNNIL